MLHRLVQNGGPVLRAQRFFLHFLRKLLCLVTCVFCPDSFSSLICFQFICLFYFLDLLFSSLLVASRRVCVSSRLVSYLTLPTCAFSPAHILSEIYLSKLPSIIYVEGLAVAVAIMFVCYCSILYLLLVSGTSTFYHPQCLRSPAGVILLVRL